jgi:hypothetical protein
MIRFRGVMWVGHVACMEELRNAQNAYKTLVRKPKEKRPLSRPRNRLKDNIKMDLKEVG